MTRRTDEQLVALICAELDRQTASLHPNLQARLDEIREQALQQATLARNAEEQTLAAAARDALDRDGEPGADIAARLDAIRGEALTRLPADAAMARTGMLARLRLAASRALSGWEFPAGMVAAGLVLVTAVMLLRPWSSVETLTAEQELALLASVEDIELYENLEFYLWLADSGLTTQ